MRLLLAALLLVPAIAFGAEGEGRYNVSQSPMPIGAIFVDSKTGETWHTVADDGDRIIWVRIPFSCGKDMAGLPNCTKRLIPSKPKDEPQ